MTDNIKQKAGGAIAEKESLQMTWEEYVLYSLEIETEEINDDGLAEIAALLRQFTGSVDERGLDVATDANPDNADRKSCPNCGEESEFVQLASGEESTVNTSPKQVGNGLLELRACGACVTTIENVLTLGTQRTVPTDANQSKDEPFR